MGNPDLELVDPFPLFTPPHTPHEVGLSEAGLRPLRPLRVFQDVAAFIDAFVGGKDSDEARVTLEDALADCDTYKQWQRSMPFLKDVPSIHAYRNRPYNDLAAVNREILRHGGYLRAGQILYRGGRFGPDKSVVTDGPMSTSMHPSVARWHASEVSGQIGVLRVAASRSVLAFVYRISGNQRLTHEYEVLLQDRLYLEQNAVRNVGGIEVRTYDLWS